MINHAYVVNKGQVDDVEIIPYSELKRPRIDVVISATGLYRDTFPQAMQLIAKAVEKISALKEKNNYLRDNSLALEEKLSKNKDINASEAKYYRQLEFFQIKLEIMEVELMILMIQEDGQMIKEYLKIMFKNLDITLEVIAVDGVKKE